MSIAEPQTAAPSGAPLLPSEGVPADERPADRLPAHGTAAAMSRIAGAVTVPVQRHPSAYRGWRFTAPERITFVAACPSCGRDCDWEEQRLDTRLHAIVLCPC